MHPADPHHRTPAGHTLEETAALFDGAQRPHDLAHTGSVAATRARRARTVRFSLRAIWDKPPPSPGAMDAGGGGVEEHIELPVRPTRSGNVKSPLARDSGYGDAEDDADAAFVT